MALPTLEPYWMKHYKNKTEQFHVQRTQHESDFRNKWDENSRYFQRSNVEATKKRAWQSDQCFRERFEAILINFCTTVYRLYIIIVEETVMSKRLRHHFSTNDLTQ